jgi:probable F420-dependent oxidoreductase
VRFGVVVPSYGRLGDPEAVARLIVAAERLGYEGAWFADHLVVPDYATGWLPPPILEPLSTCAFGAGLTSRLRFGVDVLVAAYRHPLVLASTAATIDRLSRGRLVVGVGVGYLEGEFAALGVPYEQRGDITDEHLRLLRDAWTTSGPVGGVHPGVQPEAPGVPLWVGGNITRALRRAAELGDGWHPLWPTPEDYAGGRRRIHELRARAGIARPFTFSYSCPLGRVLDRPRDDWGDVADPHPTRPEFGYVPPLPRAGGGRPRFTGTPEQLADDVAVFAAAGVEHLTLRFWTSGVDLDAAGVEAQMDAFATEVMPEFGS